MDGGFDNVTFICSKTDDISLMEASESLGLDEVNSPLWEKFDEQTKVQESLKQELKDLQESKIVYGEVYQDCDKQKDLWNKLKDQLEDGRTVYAPTKKRKAGALQERPAKRAR